jgi:small-conductance mechanosensitive channel
MTRLDYPLLVFVFSFFMLWLSAMIGASYFGRRRKLEENVREDFGVILAATLTLLALLIGFSFSMAINRYDQRILFYTTRDKRQLAQINAHTAQLQTELWSAVKVPTTAQPTPTVALAVSGMNDVLNSQGYTQAAWWNRIPIAAWVLMAVVAIFCNLLIGYGVRDVKAELILLLFIPLVVSVAFFLIADIDSPRGGVILVNPPNLVSLSESLHAR